MKLWKRVVVLAILMSLVNINSARADWVQEGKDWYFLQENGQKVTGWLNVSSTERYYLNEDGRMKTGWHEEPDGTWYFLDTRHEGAFGRALNSGYQYINGYCYYFLPDGQMATTGVTPDGYPQGYYFDGFGRLNKNLQEIEYRKGEGIWTGSISPQRKSLWTDRFDFTDDDIQKISDVISSFRERYIREGMSDFEKELQIIQYMVETIDYGSSSSTTNDNCHTPYGALVNKVAQCDGYSYAFDAMAEACGLEAQLAYGNSDSIAHMWNMVRLDGDWYHVDVTFEDPLPENDYGFGNLYNRYINKSDEQMAYDHGWPAFLPKCNGTKYGASAVREYLQKKR